MSEVAAFLEHYGILGMKWGVRRPRGKDGRVTNTPTPVELKIKPGKRVQARGGKNRKPSADAKRSAAYKQIARASTVDALTNQQLEALVKRVNLEQQYAKIKSNEKEAGADWLKNFLKRSVSTGGDIAMKQAERSAQQILAKKVGDALGAKGLVEVSKKKK